VRSLTAAVIGAKRGAFLHLVLIQQCQAPVRLLDELLDRRVVNHSVLLEQGGATEDGRRGCGRRFWFFIVVEERELSMTNTLLTERQSMHSTSPAFSHTVPALKTRTRDPDILTSKLYKRVTKDTIET